jgi:hypothetical protein
MLDGTIHKYKPNIPKEKIFINYFFISIKFLIFYYNKLKLKKWQQLKKI